MFRNHPGYANWDLKEWDKVVEAWEIVLEYQPQHMHVKKNMKFAQKYAREAKIRKDLGMSPKKR